MSRATLTIGPGGRSAATAKLSYVPPDHEPVLPVELVEVLDPRPGETFVDCTFGGGGHARLIAERLGPEGELIALDRDPVAEKRWREFSAGAPSRTRFLRADFVAGLEGLRGEGVRPDGIVFDLGMSSMQLDAWERGFSYAYDAPLDMRMDPDQTLTAAQLVNEWPQERIARVLREFGEERRAGSMAREIVRRRPIETTSELVAAIKAAIPPADRFGRGHPAKRAFQAIRIAVNGELEALDRALPLAWDLLAVGGRLGAISFHSLEDRRVKRFLADRARGCICPPEFPVCVCGREPEAELLTRRALAPTPEEIERNPRAGSAHLRAARKLRDEPGGEA
ncbi:MAG: 16S rRNA (cytosine(1402)-N(4))-methyltransferase RsmH [Solirubrobacterales bacterium]